MKRRVAVVAHGGWWVSFAVEGTHYEYHGHPETVREIVRRGRREPFAALNMAKAMLELSSTTKHPQPQRARRGRLYRIVRHWDIPQGVDPVRAACDAFWRMADYEYLTVRRGKVYIYTITHI